MIVGRHRFVAGMVFKKKKRFAAAVLAVLVLVAITLALFIIVREADHDCTGEDCHICETLAICNGALKTLGEILILVAALFAAAYTVLTSLVPFSSIVLHDNTPISLKVKLLN